MTIQISNLSVSEALQMQSVGDQVITSIPVVGDPSIQIDQNSTTQLRTQLIFINTSLTQKVALVRTGVPVFDLRGIILSPGQVYVEATDGGYLCYQGAIQVISDDAGATISYSIGYYG